MAGGYRVVLAGALAALIFVTFGLGWMSGTLGTHPQKGGREPQGASGQEIASPIDNFKVSLNADKESPDYKQPCDDSRPNRNSDLCAQWEAADAAKSSANANWVFGYVGSFLGFLTFGAATGAAIYAGMAAYQTKRGAKAAEDGLALGRDVSAAELRPWISIGIRLTKIEADDHGITVDYEVIFTNTGKTVAEQFHPFSGSQFVGETGYAQQIDALYERWGRPHKGGRTLMPNEEHPRATSHMTAQKLLKWHGAKDPKRVTFVAVATAHYWSPIDKSWHRTDRAFTVGLRKHDFYENRFLFSDMRGQWTGDELQAFVINPARAGKTT